MTIGRPSTFTPETWATIIAETEEGKPLRVICRELGIGKSAVYVWMAGDLALKEAYETARKEGYDVIAERLRNTARGKGESDDGDSTGDVQRDKLIVDTDLKLLAKWYSQKYGDKQQVEHSGSVSMPPDARQAEIDRLLAKRDGRA